MCELIQGRNDAALVLGGCCGAAAILRYRAGRSALFLNADKGDVTKLWSGPGLSHDIVGQIPPDAEIELGRCVYPDDATSGRQLWCEARKDDLIGFLPASEMRRVTQAGDLFDFDSSQLVGEYAPLAQPMNWDGQNSLDGSRSASPAPVADASTTPPGNYMVPVDVSGGTVPMRSGPGVTFDDIVDIPAGATGLKIGQCMAPQDNGASHKDWCIVSWNGHQGFTSSCCIAPQLAATNVPAPASQVKATLTGGRQSRGFAIDQWDGTAFQCDANFNHCQYYQMQIGAFTGRRSSAGPGRARNCTGTATKLKSPWGHPSFCCGARLAGRHRRSD